MTKTEFESNPMDVRYRLVCAQNIRLKKEIQKHAMEKELQAAALRKINAEDMEAIHMANSRPVPKQLTLVTCEEAADGFFDELEEDIIGLTPEEQQRLSMAVMFVAIIMSIIIFFLCLNIGIWH